MKKSMLIILCMTVLFACKPDKELPTVKEVNLEKYSGTWYEIARLPNKFEKGLECVTANYSLLENGKIRVINRGLKTNDNYKLKEAKGKAWRPDENYQGRLKVSFFWPFAGDYYIIDLDKDYQYVLLGTPSRKYLWVLAREKSLDNEIYNSLIQKAKALEFETEKVIKVNQVCSN